MVETNYDNWNGGTYTYSFVLRVPVPLFAELGSDREAVDSVEKAVHEELAPFLRNERQIHVENVVLMPDISLSADIAVDHEQDGPTMWPPGTFRLFISHVSAIKAKTHSLELALQRYCVAAFVAHDDIEPTRDWQSVIEAALRTMDGLTALLTPEFPTSRWCDQEVGFAIGRDRLVIPVRLGIDPYGFMGRYQGVQGKGLLPDDLANRLVAILIKHERTSRRLAEVVLRQFAEAQNYDRARALIAMLARFDQLPNDVLREVEPALKVNDQLRGAYTVPDRFKALLAKHRARPG